MADGAPDRKLQFAIGLGLFASTLLTYSSVVHHGFVDYDDQVLVLQNPNLARPLTPSHLLSYFYQPYRGNLLPLYWISMHFGMALHGPNAAAFLLTNVLLHATSAVVLFAALRRLSGAVWPSAFVAAVFALHPLHVESVAWVVERKDVLAGLFWHLGLYAYARCAETPGSWVRHLLVWLCMALGLMSKSIVVTFPVVLLLLDVWPLRRLGIAPRRVLLEKVPLFALAGLASVLTVLTQRAGSTVVSEVNLGFGWRLVNAIESYGHYLWDAVWPAGLAVLYPHPYLAARPSDSALLAAGALGLAGIGLTVLVLVASRRRPYLGVGWLWFLATLLPMIGLVQVGVQARADRYMYLPLQGLSIMLAWGVAEGLPRRRRALAAAAGVALLATLAIGTRAQLRHWQDPIALFTRAAAVTEQNAYAHSALGSYLLEAGRADEAREQYRAALAIVPRDPVLHYALGRAHERTGDRRAAMTAYRRALQLQPDLPQARGDLGLLLLDAGRVAEARPHLRAAVRTMPDSAEYREGLEEVERRLGSSGVDPSRP